MMIYLDANIVNNLVKSIFITNKSLFIYAKFEDTMAGIGFSRFQND